eukprot:jgi/Mesvir1/16361/Mv18109-RA.1
MASVSNICMQQSRICSTPLAAPRAVSATASGRERSATACSQNASALTLKKCAKEQAPLTSFKQDGRPWLLSRWCPTTRHAARARDISVQAASTAAANSTGDKVPDGCVSVLLLAGGVGKRMGASMPKQYLPLHDRPIALYSLELFSKMPEVGEVIVVCDPSYRDLFEGDAAAKKCARLKFALPGKERQDSVFNGLQAASPAAKLVCVHDSARPCITHKDAANVIRDAYKSGAAVLGVKVKATIKEADKNGMIIKTLDRSKLWEMQTPQVIETQLLKQGFELVQSKNLEVTDDVSIVEHLGHPVMITEGSYTNIKVTTPEDLLLAERVLNGDV